MTSMKLLEKVGLLSNFKDPEWRSLWIQFYGPTEELNKIELGSLNVVLDMIFDGTFK